MHSHISDASSTRMISLSRWPGLLSMTEWTVRRRTLHASLWKQMITDVSGRSERKRPGDLHLRGGKEKTFRNNTVFNNGCIYFLKK